MKILVIGATGYIGREVCQRLAAGGHSIIGFCRSDDGEGSLRTAGYRVLRGRIDKGADLTPIATASGEADCTIFVPQLDPQSETRVVTTLLDRLAGSSKRFIFTSGTGVLGQRTNGSWDERSFGEDDDPPFSKYTADRVAVENLVRSSRDHGVHGIVIRPSAVWGKGYHSIAERLLTSFETTGSVCYIGAGMNCYSSVHVDDLADLFELAVERGVPGALYHASSGEVPNRCIAEILAARPGCDTRSVTIDEAFGIWGKFATLIVLAVSSRTRSERSRKELGWTPTREGVIDYLSRGPLSPG